MSLHSSGKQSGQRGRQIVSKEVYGKSFTDFVLLVPTRDGIETAGYESGFTQPGVWISLVNRNSSISITAAVAVEAMKRGGGGEHTREETSLHKTVQRPSERPEMSPPIP